MRPLRLERAENDTLFDVDGRAYVDLFTAHGTTWLGHAQRGIAARIARQLETIWIAGGLGTDVLDEASAAIAARFPDSHAPVALYSTGMEAAEFALRVARVVTGRSGVIGFERSMHGKSLATASLGWDNAGVPDLPFVHRLPFVPAAPEAEILERSRALLRRGEISAVFVEPIQGSGGGHMATPRFYVELAALCREHDALLVFDEILSGFHRTGPSFFFADLGFVPDIVLIGKALGNGFPVSAVVVDRRLPLQPRMLPGSTFSGNPLAAAAVVATLEQMASIDLAARVAWIERTVRERLVDRLDERVAVRGRGALWVVELPPRTDLESVVLRIYRRGVSVGFTHGQLRVLPPVTIEEANLERAADVLREELARVGNGE